MIMSRSHDLISVATGDVRVSVEDLAFDQQIKLFTWFTRNLHLHYDFLKGGSRFLPWVEENFGKNLTHHSIRRHSLALNQSLYPKISSYQKGTRIVVLGSDYFHLPGIKSSNSKWSLGDMKLVVRFCLTQCGDLYLEWYEGEAVEMDKKHPTLPVKFLVHTALYMEIPPFMTTKADIPQKLKTLLESAPSILCSFCFGALELLSHEIEDREKRVNRDKELFNKLNGVGKLIGITYP